MPGKLVNTTLSSLASGVSEAYEAGRYDSQVSEMVNCIASIPRGILRRNPLQAVADLSDVGLDNSFVHAYDRGTDDEQYISILRGDGYISVFNMNTGDKVYTSGYNSYLVSPIGTRAKDTFKALTIGDHTFIVNTTIVTTFTKDLTSNYGYSDMAFYWIKKTTSVVTDQYQTGVGTDGQPVESGSKTKGYDYTLNNLQINAGADTRPESGGFTRIEMNRSTLIAEAFVGAVPTTSLVPNMLNNTTPEGEVYASHNKDHAWLAFSNILLETGEVDWNGNPIYTSTWMAGSPAAYIQYKLTTPEIMSHVSILSSAFSNKNSDSIEGGASPEDFDVLGSDDGIYWTIIKSFRDVTSWKVGETKVLRLDNNATAYLYYRLDVLKTNSNVDVSLNDLKFLKEDANYSSLSQATHITTDNNGDVNSSICYTLTEPTKWDWEDSFGSEASRGVWQTVPDSEELPALLPEDLDEFKVKVNGSTQADSDDYFLSYTHDSKSWKETMAPGISYKLDGSTMPHTLYRLGDGSFLFDEYKIVNDDGVSLAGSAWGERIVGGADLSTEDPSFIGQKLNNLFFFRNRLGFLTNDTIVLSRTGDYSNFFLKTLQELLDDDHIDLAIASTDVSVLQDVVAINGKLIIFSQDTQFLLDTVADIFTSETASITSLSNYTYNKSAQAKSIGNKIYFTNNSGKYSQVFSYQSDPDGDLNAATPKTLHLPTYINKTPYKLIGHDVLGYIFIATEDAPQELIVLNSITTGTTEIQNAFHKWTFDLDILSIHIINNLLYILFTNGNLGSIDLDIPGSIDDVVYLDKYNPIEEEGNEYASYIEFSQFYLRDNNGKGTERGRYQLRTMKHDITDNSYYTTKINSVGQLLIADNNTMISTWKDATTWADEYRWVDVSPEYSRYYSNDSKVTIMGDAKNIRIVFSNNEEYPDKGFELATTNIEGYFHQRSTRT